MVFGKKKKELEKLKQKYQAFEMAFQNNYKDLAISNLKEYEEMLEPALKSKFITQDYYEKQKEHVKEKFEALKNFNHKQHIGW